MIYFKLNLILLYSVDSASEDLQSSLFISGFLIQMQKPMLKITGQRSSLKLSGLQIPTS